MLPALDVKRWPSGDSDSAGRSGSGAIIERNYQEMAASDNKDM